MDTLDSTNLIIFESPPVTVRKSEWKMEKPSTSPGSNPFDTELNRCEDGIERPTLFVEGMSPNLSTPHFNNTKTTMRDSLLTKQFDNTVQKSSIMDMAFIEGSTYMFSDSDFTNTCEIKESLGVLNISQLLDDFDCGRPSLDLACVKLRHLGDDLSDKLSQNLNDQYVQHPTYRSFLKSLDSVRSDSEVSKIYRLQSLGSGSSTSTVTDWFNVGMHSTGLQEDLESVSAKLTYDVNMKKAQTVTSAEGDENDLDDSVFIVVEARNLASRIADGSILEQTSSINIIQETSSPELTSDEVPQEPVGNDNHAASKATSQDSVNTSDKNNNSFKTNQDPHDVLQNLSEIVNNKITDNNQRVEGISLVNALANLLCSDTEQQSREVACDSEDGAHDSGHSSLENEGEIPQTGSYGCCTYSETPTKKLTYEEEQITPLDLSLGSKSAGDTSVSKMSHSLPQCLSKLKSSSPQISKSLNLNSQSATKSGNSSSVSQKSITSKSVSGDSKYFNSFFKEPILGKLKLKKADYKRVGPMKATTHIDTQIQEYGRKSEMKLIPKPQAQKKTSTPVSKSRIQPIAQSTPTNQIPVLNRSLSEPDHSDGRRVKSQPLISPNIPSNSGSLNKSNISSMSGSVPNTSKSLQNSSNSFTSPSLKQGFFQRNLPSSILKKSVDQIPMRRSFSGKDVSNTTATAPKTLRRASFSFSGKNTKSEGSKLLDTLNLSRRGKTQNLLSKLK